MQVKVTKRAFYENRLIEEGEIIDFKGDKIPSWCVSMGEVEAVAPAPAKKAEEIKTPEKPEKPKTLKVNDLPEEEKTALINKAMDLGIKGLLGGFGVDTLKAKIAKEEAKKAEEV